MIFSKADKNNSGTLNLKDFQEVVKDVCERYPQVGLYLKKRQMRDIADLLKSSQAEKQGKELDIAMFKSVLSEVDSQMKNLPATAQVKVRNYFLLNRLFLLISSISGSCSTRAVPCQLFQPHGRV